MRYDENLTKLTNWVEDAILICKESDKLIRWWENHKPILSLSLSDIIILLWKK